MEQAGETRAGKAGEARLPPGAARWLKRHGVFLVFLAFAAPASFAWTVHDVTGEVFGDGASYMMMAQHYSPFDVHDRLYATTAAFIRFPPLYPLLLALTGAAGNLSLTHVVTTSCLLLALAALYGWSRTTGLSPLSAAALTLLITVLPGTWTLGLLIQSEYLYLCLSLTALWLMALHRREGSPSYLHAAALMVAAAALTRTVGISLLPALLAAGLGRSRRNSLVALSLATAPMIAWLLMHRVGVGYTAALQDSYGNGRWLSGLRTTLATMLPALWNGYGSNFTNQPSPTPVGHLLAMIGFAASALRLRRLEPDGVYLAANVAILAVWPFPEEAQRFVWTLVPVTLVQAALAISSLPLRARQAAVAAAAGAALWAVVPALTYAAQRYQAAQASDIPGAAGFAGWYYADPERATRDIGTEVALIDALHMMQEKVPAGDCVLSIRPDVVNYYGRRRSTEPPPDSVPDPYFMQAIERTGCRYVFALAAPNRIFPKSMHPLQRLGASARALYVVDTPGEPSYRMAALIRLDR